MVKNDYNYDITDSPPLSVIQQLVFIDGMVDVNICVGCI
jgi:hypothetical protein